MSKYLKTMLILIAIWLPMLEVSSCVGLHLRADRFVYRPPDLSEAEFRNYLATQDPVLGWPSIGDWILDHGLVQVIPNVAQTETWPGDAQ